MMYQFSPVSLPSPLFLSIFRFRRPFWGLIGEIEFSLTPCGFAGIIPLKYGANQALRGFQYRVLISSNFHQSPFGREHSKTVCPSGHVGSNPTRCAKTKGPLQNESFAAVPFSTLRVRENREIVENLPQISRFLYNNTSPDPQISAKC